MADFRARSVAAQVEALVAPVLQPMGFLLWDVRYEKEGPHWYLRILIDNADGSPMDTDACERASRAVDPIIDEADPIPQSYFLEVGSPGLGRRLTRAEHYARCEGRPVSVRLIRAQADGRRDFSGTLCRAGEGWCLRTPQGGWPLPQAGLAFCKLDDDIDD